MWCNLVNQQCKLAVLIHSGVSPWVSASRFVLALINNLWKSLWQCTQALLFCLSVCRFNYGSQFGRFEFVLLASLSQPEQRAGLSARMCTESHSPFLSLSIQVFSWGSDWRRLYQDNLAQKSTTFFFILRGSWAVPKKLEYRLFLSGKVFAFWASVCLCFVGLCTQDLDMNVRLWKLSRLLRLGKQCLL